MKLEFTKIRFKIQIHPNVENGCNGCLVGPLGGANIKKLCALCVTCVNKVYCKSIVQ